MASTRRARGHSSTLREGTRTPYRLDVAGCLGERPVFSPQRNVEGVATLLSELAPNGRESLRANPFV